METYRYNTLRFFRVQFGLPARMPLEWCVVRETSRGMTTNTGAPKGGASLAPSITFAIFITPRDSAANCWRIACCEAAPGVRAVRAGR